MPAESDDPDGNNIEVCARHTRVFFTFIFSLTRSLLRFVTPSFLLPLSFSRPEISSYHIVRYIVYPSLPTEHGLEIPYLVVAVQVAAETLVEEKVDDRAVHYYHDENSIGRPTT